MPARFKSDYLEACEISQISPRSSATLSRRIVEAVLREQGYCQRNLFKQIQAVRSETNPDRKLPTTLMKFIDAARKFGNFSAHEKVNLKTLQIIEMEPGEAKICLEIVEEMFEHYYVKPAVEKEKVKIVNEKLEELERIPK